MIWQRVQIWLFYLVRFVVAISAIAIVTYDLFNGIEWQMPAFIGSFLERLEDNPPPAEQDEIRKYVQFTNVKYGQREVVTGTEFASDRNRNITKQWCYVSGSISGGRRVQLTLATKTGTGSSATPNHPRTALADFDLTARSARALINSHCRFQ